MLQDIIIDRDIFSLDDQIRIKEYMTGMFPWYLGEGHESTSSINQYSNSSDVYEYMQLCHGFVNEFETTSGHHKLTAVVEQMLQAKYPFLGRVKRIKANLQTKIHNTNTNAHNTPHIDDDLDHWVALYYVNNSDGDTFIFDADGITVKQQITPQQGQVVIFDGSTLHAGMHPRTTDYRIVINFNFLKQ
jgi:hypothetical protein